MRLLPALLAVLLATPATAQEEFTLVLDWFVNPDHGPIIIAQERGYFEEEGLNVEVVAPADPADPPKMVAADKADLGVSYQPQLHLQVHEGLPLTRVGTLIASPLNCLLVLEEGPIDEIADLAGCSIGFSVAGVEEAMLEAILGEHGVSMDEVELVNVNFSLAPAVMSGQVDAVIGAYRNFELNQMAIEGRPGRCFYVEEQGLPAYDELIYIANPETMEADKIRRFLAATERAHQFIVNHPDEAWQGHSKNFSGYEVYDVVSVFAEVFSGFGNGGAGASDEGDGDVAQRGERPCAGAHAASVFVEGDITDVVEAVFDGPMVARIVSQRLV